MKKLLITGSSGFIGKHMLPILQCKFDIHCLKSDLRNHSAVTHELCSFEPDLVIHLAARTEVEQSFYEQIEFSEINYVGTVNLIESMLQCSKIPKLIFASTMEVYGWQPVSDLVKNGQAPDTIPVFDPDTTIPNPNAPYAVAKYGCEKYIEYAHRSYGLQYVIVRQTNAYGRSDNNFFVTEQIITQMLDNPNECNLGYQGPYRNFIYITDLLAAWEIMIDQFDHIANNIFTMGPNNAISIEDYVKLIAKNLNWKGRVNWNTKPCRPGEIWVLNSSEEKLTKFTGWKPVVSMEQGLDKTIDIWKKIKNLQSLGPTTSSGITKN
jgi:nucleoside-diphosphate-sugar epimerase